MPPRKLKVLRIDDKLRVTANVETVPQEDMPPEPIELFKWGEFIAINSWNIALHGWLAYQGNRVPDLVVADVRFDKDRSSPLSKVLSKIEKPPSESTSEETPWNPLPTGLSHVKPFAAMARAAGIPIGIGIHTADPGQWSRLIEYGKVLEQCMGYMAAHEIGELAAILGDTLSDDQMTGGNPEPYWEWLEKINWEGSLEPYWEWLEKNAAFDFQRALRLAIRNYRKRLLTLADPPSNSVFVMPDDYATVMKWCAQMEDTPQPLNADNDPGLVLTYSDGMQDSIFLASLFADFRNITTHRLDASCFAIPADDDLLLHDLDNLTTFDFKGYPRIGAFLKKLGKLATVYKEAAGVVFLFSDSPDDFKEGEVKERKTKPKPKPDASKKRSVRKRREPRK